ncbi:MAG TPA: outer membrane beta-barrel protein [Rhodopila sp.]|nr:outer membrane beta-barrel protein [Rhodopila sp.]
MFLALVGSICVIGRATAEILTALLPDGVPGYDDGPGVTVETRLHPEQMPLGLREGPVVIAPKLAESIGYDSNELSGPTKGGSWEVGTDATLGLSSETARTTLGAIFSLEDRRVLAYPDQSRTDGTVSAGGRFSAGQDEITAAVAHIERHEDRGALDTLPSDRPVAFHVDDVRLAYTFNRAPWSLTPEVEATEWRYDPTTIGGLPVDQSYRDRVVVQAGVTLRYALVPLRDLVFVVRGLGQDYTHTPAGQINPGSRGYQVLAGISDSADPVWHWRMLVGGEIRRFNAAAYRAHNTAIAEAGVSWSPSGMTTVSGTISRETDAAAQEGVSGATYTTARLAIDHELRRDVLLNGWVGWQRQDDFQGGYQAGTRFGVGVTWVVNRMTRLVLTFDQVDMHGSAPVAGIAPGYSRGLGLMTVKLGL